MDIKGTAAVVTGGASGIGRATAVALADAGSQHLHIFDVNEAGAHETAAMVQAVGAKPKVFILDVADHAAFALAFAEAALSSIPLRPRRSTPASAIVSTPQRKQRCFPSQVPVRH